MKRSQVLLGSAVMALTLGGLAAAAPRVITVMKGSELAFKAVRPGVERATLWGDPDKGAWGGLARRAAGFIEPWHTHTHDLRLLVVSGTLSLEGLGDASQTLGPSSYVHVPAHVRHRLGCGPDAPCTWFIEQGGRYDIIPDAAAKAK